MKLKWVNVAVVIGVVFLSIEVFAQYQEAPQELSKASPEGTITQEAVEKEFERVWEEMDQEKRELLISLLGAPMAYDTLRVIISRKAAENLKTSEEKIMAIVTGTKVSIDSTAKKAIEKEFERVWRDIDKNQRQQFISLLGVSRAYDEIRSFIIKRVANKLGMGIDEVIQVISPMRAPGSPGAPTGAPKW